jgi:hypothetical protein
MAEPIPDRPVARKVALTVAMFVSTVWAVEGLLMLLNKSPLVDGYHPYSGAFLLVLGAGFDKVCYDLWQLKRDTAQNATPPAGGTDDTK